MIDEDQSEDIGIRELAFNGSLFLATGRESNRIFVSSLGDKWTQRTVSQTQADLKAIAGSEETTVDVGRKGLLAIAKAGDDWEIRDLPSSGNANDVVYGSDRFVAVGRKGFSTAGKAYLSQNGTDWSESDFVANSPFHDVAYGNPAQPDRVRQRNRRRWQSGLLNGSIYCDGNPDSTSGSTYSFTATLAHLETFEEERNSISEIEIEIHFSDTFLAFDDPSAAKAHPSVDPHESGFDNAIRFALGLGANARFIERQGLPILSLKEGSYVFSADLANDPDFSYSIERLGSDGRWNSIPSATLENEYGETGYRPHPLTPTRFRLLGPLTELLILRIAVNYGKTLEVE